MNQGAVYGIPKVSNKQLTIPVFTQLFCSKDSLALIQNLADPLEIENIYRHFYGTSGRSREITIEYRILIKQLHVVTRIVMVEKHKAPFRLLPNRPNNNGRIYRDARDMRNYYYEADEDDEGDIIIEIDDIEQIDGFGRPRPQPQIVQDREMNFDRWERIIRAQENPF